jgi:hypothetical protein
MKFDKEIKGGDVKYTSDYFNATYITSEHEQEVHRGTRPM